MAALILGFLALGFLPQKTSAFFWVSPRYHSCIATLYLAGMDAKGKLDLSQSTARLQEISNENSKKKIDRAVEVALASNERAQSKDWDRPWILHRTVRGAEDLKLLSEKFSLINSALQSAEAKQWRTKMRGWFITQALWVFAGTIVMPRAARLHEHQFHSQWELWSYLFPPPLMAIGAGYLGYGFYTLFNDLRMNLRGDWTYTAKRWAFDSGSPFKGSHLIAGAAPIDSDFMKDYISEVSDLNPAIRLQTARYHHKIKPKNILPSPYQLRTHFFTGEDFEGPYADMHISLERSPGTRSIGVDGNPLIYANNGYQRLQSLQTDEAEVYAHTDETKPGELLIKKVTDERLVIVRNPETKKLNYYYFLRDNPEADHNFEVQMFEDPSKLPFFKWIQIQRTQGHYPLEKGHRVPLSPQIRGWLNDFATAGHTPYSFEPTGLAGVDSEKVRLKDADIRALRNEWGLAL